MIRPLASLTRSGIALLITAALLSPQIAFAQTPDATPQLPEGPLGVQIQWLLDTLNTPASNPSTSDQLGEHFTADFLKQVPATQLVAVFGQLHGQAGTVTIEASSLVTSRDMPPTNARFILVGEHGTRLQASIQIDRESGKIAGLVFQPATAAASPPAASPAASPAATTYRDKDVQFTSGPDTIYGSLMAPKSAATPLPAALIISGSGPTDRNGNSGTLTAMNTNLNLARTLADNGVISLRYDKLGSGQTGLGTHTNGEGIDYNLFLQEARDATAFLMSQPGVDPGRLILVGHSEGALFALVLAQELTAAGTPPAGVILVSPLSIRYLDILKDQLEPQFAQAVEGGQMTQQQADDARQELDTIITSLQTNGTLPETVSSPALAQIFSPANAAFLAQIDKIDPAEVAASLPPTLPVLVLHGGKDQQVTAAQVRHLMAGFEQAGNTEATLVELPDADHLMKVITGTPNPAVDYANPDLPFSAKAVE
ncbi:MAG TPA: alpha/beta fold hydrolase, partial [Thermomicrobiales bacterium]|nr:alpha/beta fold hydrolase [Thermomicrobiales bacterium]